MDENDQRGNTPPDKAQKVSAAAVSNGWRETYTRSDIARLCDKFQCGKNWVYFDGQNGKPFALNPLWNFPEQAKRLKADRDGLALLGLNRLKSPHPEGVLLMAAQAAELAESRHDFMSGCKERAEWFEAKSAEAKRLADDLKMLAPLGYLNALLELAGYLEGQAAFYRKTVEQAPVSRKRGVENAAAIAAIRALRQGLYGDAKQADHDAIVFLASAALGIKILKADGNQWPNWVKTALRITSEDSVAKPGRRIRKIKKIK